MKRCAFVTLGCKVNHYDTQALREQAARSGYVEAREGESADVVIVNTCTVTERSGAKSRHQVYRAIRENPGAAVVVTGCYADSDPERIEAIPGVTRVAGNRHKGAIFDALEGFETGSPPSIEARELPGITRFDGQTRAFLKVQDGCNLHCSYCIIPRVRGASRSKSMEGIAAEARELVDSGHREIVLTGVHLGGYGKDRGEREALARLVERLCRVRGLDRLRLSSIEATEVTPGLLSALGSSEKCCPHFHLPLQSGDDGVLARMRRRYSAARFLRAVERIRSAFDRPSLTTDVIVGYPGETEDAHRNTERACEAAGFHKIHLFPYSRRRGTAAAALAGGVSVGVVARRQRSLERLEARLALAFHREFVGEEVDVLGEEPAPALHGALTGFTERYVRVVYPAERGAPNRISRVRVALATPRQVFAEGLSEVGASRVEARGGTDGA